MAYLLNMAILLHLCPSDLFSIRGDKQVYSPLMWRRPIEREVPTPWLRQSHWYRLYNIPSELEIDMYHTIDYYVYLDFNVRLSWPLVWLFDLAPSLLLTGCSESCVIVLWCCMHPEHTLDYTKSSPPRIKPCLHHPCNIEPRIHDIIQWQYLLKNIASARQSELPHLPFLKVFLLVEEVILNLQDSLSLRERRITSRPTCLSHYQTTLLVALACRGLAPDYKF